MDRIYNDAKDKNVAKVIIYGVYEDDDSGSHVRPGDIPFPYAYADAALTKKLTIPELRDAFLKGCIARVADASQSPIEFLSFNATPVMNTILETIPSEELPNKFLGMLWFIGTMDGKDITTMPLVSDIADGWDG